jgi:hypothetical protein
MQNEPRVVERSSGYWVVNDTGVVEGPFNSIREAITYMDGNVILNSFDSVDDYTIVEKKDDQNN